MYRPRVQMKNPIRCLSTDWVFHIPIFIDLFRLKPHQSQRHPITILQHLNAIIIPAVAHKALFGNSKVVVFALEGACRNALPFVGRIDVERVLACHFGIAKEKDVVVVAFDGHGEPPHIDRLFNVLDAVFVKGN